VAAAVADATSRLSYRQFHKAISRPRPLTRAGAQRAI